MNRYLIIFLLFPSLGLSQSNVEIIKNYEKSGPCFYTNNILDRYSISDGKFIAITNLTGKCNGLVSDGIFFKAGGKEIIIELTTTKNTKRYGKLSKDYKYTRDYRLYYDTETLIVTSNGVERVNGEYIPKFLEVEKLTLEKFMKYWRANEMGIKEVIEKRGNILKYILTSTK